MNDLWLGLSLSLMVLIQVINLYFNQEIGFDLNSAGCSVSEVHKWSASFDSSELFLRFGWIKKTSRSLHDDIYQLRDFFFIDDFHNFLFKMANANFVFIFADSGQPDIYIYLMSGWYREVDVQNLQTDRS